MLGVGFLGPLDCVRVLGVLSRLIFLGVNTFHTWDVWVWELGLRRGDEGPTSKVAPANHLLLVWSFPTRTEVHPADAVEVLAGDFSSDVVKMLGCRPGEASCHVVWTLEEPHGEIPVVRNRAFIPESLREPAGLEAGPSGPSRL